MVSVRLGCEVVKTNIAVYKKRESGAQHNRSSGSVVQGLKASRQPRGPDEQTLSRTQRRINDVIRIMSASANKRS